MGMEPGHALARDLIDGMIATPAEGRHLRYALGTHLLQEVVGAPARADVVVHPPAVFYPLGPEISAHWFRLRHRVRLADVIRPGTRVAHWYASVDTREVVRTVDPGFIRAHADRQLFSALVAPLLD
jgi:hypothetical protein